MVIDLSAGRKPGHVHLTVYVPAARLPKRNVPSGPVVTGVGRPEMVSWAPEMGELSVEVVTVPEMEPVFWPLRSMMMRALR